MPPAPEAKRYRTKFPGYLRRRRSRIWNRIGVGPGTHVSFVTPVVGISVGTPHTPTHVYIDTVTVTVYVSGIYIPPKSTAVPATITLAPVLLTQPVMPTPTLVNGRPT